MGKWSVVNFYNSFSFYLLSPEKQFLAIADPPPPPVSLVVILLFHIFRFPGEKKVFAEIRGKGGFLVGEDNGKGPIQFSPERKETKKKEIPLSIAMCVKKKEINWIEKSFPRYVSGISDFV